MKRVVLFIDVAIAMLIDSKIYKGIEYIQLNELPQSQREKLSQTLNKDLIIKIMINGTIVPDCLQYKDYTLWYHSIYRPKQASTSQQKSAVLPVQEKQVA